MTWPFAVKPFASLELGLHQSEVTPEREADRARVHHRIVVRPASGPVDPARVRGPPPSAVSLCVAAGARPHPAETPAGPAPARSGGDRRVAPDRVAAHQKKARRQGASLALIDESGLLMAPLVRRTWSWRGHTPKLGQEGGRGQKVSVAAALWLSPRRVRLGLFSRTLVNDYFDPWYSAAFLEALLKELS